MLRRFNSVVFWSFVCLSSIVLFGGALILFVVVGPFDRRRRVQHLYSCFWAQIYFYVNPLWRLRIEGRDRLPRRGGAVLVSNHESLGDILVLFGLYRPFKWVSKASVFRVPLIGWNMRFNRYVALVRGSRSSIVKMLEECRAWLSDGVPVLVFPEGTRSPDGRVRTFKDGAFQLAVEANCPVFPIAITGTADILPKHGFVLRKRADCRVRVLPPVSPAELDGDVDKLRDRVRSLIVEERERMRG